MSIRQEAHYRGYRIEGVKQGQGILLRVAPTRPDLPVLRYAHFRTLQSTWVKAVGVVVGYIDEAFIDFVKVRTYEPTDKAQVDEFCASAPRRIPGEGQVLPTLWWPKRRTIRVALR